MAKDLVVRNVKEDAALALKQLAASPHPKRQSLAETLPSMPNVGEDADFDSRNVQQ